MRALRAHYNRRMNPLFRVRHAQWERDRDSIRRIREKVFVEEQNVPPELEWDGLDEGCTHVLAVDSAGSPIGTARLLPDGHIGRMAVLSQWRGKGVGGTLLTELMKVARGRGFPDVVLNAQTQAMDFYRRFDFAPEGEEFLDAGIPHRRMRHVLG
jgi:predicted GNAT family N-acyltransferase